MEEQGRAGRVKRWMPVMTVLVIIITGCFFILHKKEAYELQQNVYFMEWVNGKDETIFYRYTQENKEVTKVGAIEGEFRHCVINRAETCITCIQCNNDSKKRIRYNLLTGEIEYENIGEKIEILTEGAKNWNALLLYDEGNKILISYDDMNEDEKWLFYDFSTGEYDIVEGKNSVTEFLAIDDNTLWYMSAQGRTLYRYNMEADISTGILNHVGNAAVAVNTNFIAYIKDSIRPKKIYQYDVDGKRNKCVAAGGWNITYGNLFDNRGQWSIDGKQFFYIKYFPRFFSAADVSLMVYNTETGRSFCIYKEKNTLHQFRYIGHSG